MKNKNFLLLSFILLLPKQIEKILEIYQAKGNMGLYGVFLSIYYCRNIFWTTIGLFLLSLFLNAMCGLKIFIGICLGLFYIKYLTCIKKYEYVFDNIFIQT